MKKPHEKELLGLFEGVSQGGSAVRMLSKDQAQRLESLLGSLQSELQGDLPAREMAVDGYMHLIVSLILRADPASHAIHRAASPVSLSGQALEFVARRATSKISLDDVARYLGRSKAYTATLVKTETGRTVGAWIEHARLTAARQLLLESDETIEIVAERVGFASPSHFHRVFKRAYNLTPSAWRKMHRTQRA